jgi:DNA-directed RNA polymerase specialized sigma24 family protein
MALRNQQGDRSRRPCRGASVKNLPMPRVGHVVIAEIEELYRARRPEFCRAAAAITGDRNLGEDAVQEAFAKAVRKRRSFKGRGTLEAWVWRIVVNAARDARRRASATHLRQFGLAEEGAGSNGSIATLPFELLTDHQREVLFLHYYADLDYATIAEALGISSGTVGATLSTARRTLRRALTHEVIE